MLDSTDWKKFTGIYILICLLNIVVFNIAEYAYLELLFKPLIMISILMYSFKNLRSYTFYNWVFTAFVFSWLGDVFLLGQGINDLFFVAGLASFLISHILYALYFYKSANHTWSKKPSILGLQFTICVLVAAFYSLMYPGLGDLSIPVLCYVSAIGFMGMLALNRFNKVNAKSFWFVLAGALFFILSDSIIGYNKFVNPLPFAHVYIMTFYCIAQYLILKGFVLGKENRT